MKIPIVPKPARPGAAGESAATDSAEASSAAAAASESALVPETQIVSAEEDALDPDFSPSTGEFVEGQAKTVPPDAKTPLSIRVDNLLDEGVGTERASSRIAGAGGTFHAEQHFTSPPGAKAAPTVGEGHGPDGGLVRNGVKLSSGVVFENDDGDAERVSGSVKLAGGKVGLAADGAVADGVGWDASVGLKKTFLTASGGLTLADPAGEVNRYGWFMGADPKFNTLVLGGGMATTDNGVTTDLFGMIAGSASREVRDLGPYDGPNPDLAGTRKVEVQRKVGGALIGILGVLDLVGVGARLVPSKNKEVIYRTHLDDGEARRVAYEKAGLGKATRNKARALGFADEPLNVPDMDDLDALKVGDELIVNTEGGLSAGVALGSGASKVGVYTLMNGEFRLGVRRLSEEHVELMVTPTKLRGLHAAAGAPFILDVSLAKTRAKSLSQGFIFDVSKESGREAYARALQGQLPNGFSNSPKAVDAKNPAAMRELLRDEKLPEGVTRTYLEAAEVAERKAGGGLNFGLLHTYWGIGGLSAHTHRVDEDRTITDGDLAISTSTRGIEKRREILLSGRESLGVSASLRRVSTFDDDGTVSSKLQSLGLSAHFADDRVRGFELNEKMIDQINDVFGTDIAHFKRKGRNQTREIRVSRDITPEDFQRLADLDETTIRAVSKRAGAKVEWLHGLVGSMQTHGSDLERASAVQSFIQDRGLMGMGMLHRALDGQKKALNLQTVSNAYTKPVERARSFTFEFAKPVDQAEEKSQLTRRFKAAFDILNEVAEGLEDAFDDPLLDDDTRNKWTMELEQTGRQVGDTIAVHHLDDDARARMRQTLERGWTSGVQKRIMSMLSPVTLRFPEVNMP